VRGAALVLIASLAGCYNDTPGMRLVIRDPGFGAHHVELFIATRQADTDRIGPDRSRMGEQRGKLQGNSYFLDGPGDDITPVTRLDFSGKRVVWDLQAEGDGPSKIKILVAIAYDANNTAIAVAKMEHFEVPAHETIAVVLDLESATQMPPSDNALPDGVRVWTWRKMDASAAACVGIEYSNGNDVAERKWLVPENDPDCDDVRLECDEHLHRADYSEAATSCIIPATPNPNHIPCKLGEKVCQDDISAGECVALAAPAYCIADALCDPDACFLDPAGCQQIDSSGVECELAIQQDGTICPEATTGSGPLPVELSNSGALFPGGCEAVAFAVSDMATAFRSSPTATVGGATFSITGLQMPQCSFSIVVTGQFDSMAANNLPLVLALDVTNPPFHYIIPVFLSLKPAQCIDREPACNSSRGSNIELGACQ
jgi:hypothetical protein